MSIYFLKSTSLFKRDLFFKEKTLINYEKKQMRFGNCISKTTENEVIFHAKRITCVFVYLALILFVLQGNEGRGMRKNRS